MDVLREVLVSARIYAPRLARQWWGGIGLIAAVVGIILDLTGWAQPSSIFWVIVAVGTVAMASFQLFHSDRVQRAQSAAAFAGPALPYWDGIGIRGQRGGETYVEVMACSDDLKRPALSTQDFPALRAQLLAAMHVNDRDVTTRSLANFFEIAVLGAAGSFERMAKVDASNLQLFIKLSWRLPNEPTSLSEVLVRSVDGLRALRTGACARALGERPWLLLFLGDWPKGGINLDGMLDAKSWAQSDHRAQAIFVQDRLGTKENEWGLVVQFASKILGDAGFVDYEGTLQTVSEAAARATFTASANQSLA